MKAGLVALLLVAAACGEAEPTIDTIPFDGRPSAVLVAHGKVWVADDEHHTVHVLHREGEKDGEPVEVGRNPIALAAASDGVWVASASGRLSKIATRTRKVTSHRVADASLTSVALIGDRAFATDVERGVYDLSRRRWIPVAHGAVRAVAAGGHLWVSGRENTVTRVIVATEQQRPYEVGFGPIGLAVLDGEVWVANSDDHSVQQVGESRFVPVGRAPVALAGWMDLLYVADQDGRSVSVVDPGGRSVERTIAVDTQPRGIAAGMGAVWVVGTNREVLVRVEL